MKTKAAGYLLDKTYKSFFVNDGNETSMKPDEELHWWVYFEPEKTKYSARVTSAETKHWFQLQLLKL